jgi:mannose/cellobiose epimerase-like protein (N-acyl-D-glucosamine 2-epimerase family)
MNNHFVQSQFESELTDNILPYWLKTAPDHENAVFFGAVYNDGRIDNNVLELP